MRIFMISLAAFAVMGPWIEFCQADPPSDAQPRFPIADNEEAWKLLPRENSPLPEWARMLVQSLPRTTGAMLELDYLHRVKNPLGPILAGKLRWAAAEAMGCEYARRCAEADLRRAGMTEDELQRLTTRQDMPDADRVALTFASKLTRAAHQVSDDQMTDLINRFGPEQVVGMVHTLAYANFQNRIFLALGVSIESSGPIPPTELQLDPVKRAEVATPRRPLWEEVRNSTIGSGIIFRPDWSERSFGELQQSLDRQKKRTSRIPLPDASRLTNLPPDAKTQASRIVWSNVSMGYQPLLTKAWFDCLRAFQEEAKLDRVFSNSLFWVITRSNECFY